MANKNPKKTAIKAADEPRPQSNIDRLLKHLKKDSLAAKLVQARHDPKANDPAESMKKVLSERLNEVKAAIGNP